MKRRALFVFPDYTVPGLDSRTFAVLQKCGVLSRNLGMYNRTGFRQDMDNITRHFPDKDDVLISSLTSEVTKADLLSTLRDMVDEATGLLILVYCGHGLLENGMYTMVCSYKHRVCESDIHEVLSARGFSGTFIPIVNLVTDESGHNDAPKLKECLSAWKEAKLVATSRMDELCQAYMGSSFIQCLSSALDDDPYIRAFDVMRTTWPSSCTSISHTDLLNQRFGQ